MEAQIRPEIHPFPCDESSGRISHDNLDEDHITSLFTDDLPDIHLLFSDNARQIQEEIHTFNETEASQTEQAESNGQTSSPTCFSCAKTRKFESGHEIKKAQHLVYGRYVPFSNINQKFDSAIKTVSDKLGIRQRYFYEHHAIITEVLETSDRTAKVKIVEFQSIGPFTVKVLESPEPIVIDIDAETNLFYKDYNDLPYTDDEIIERARSKVGESAYNLISNNCEHVAVWCVSGERESFQAAAVVDQGARKVFSWIGSIIGKIIRVFFSTDEIILGSNVAKYAAFAVPYIALAGGLFLIELIFTITRFIILKNQLKKGIICLNCYNRQKTFLISKMLCSVIASVALFFIPTAGVAHIAIATIALGVAATFIIPGLASWIYRKIKTIVNPMYEIPKMIITKPNQINPGDIINIPPDHDVVVRRVKRISRRQPSGFVHLQIVHFQCRGVFSSRTIQKELFSFKLGENLLEVLDFNPEDVYPDNEVVQNALDRIEKKGFNTLWYRSSHMAKFCKVKDYENRYWWKLNDVRTLSRSVRTRDDVKAGDVVNFRYFGLKHIGVVVERLPPADVVEIEYVHVEDGVVRVVKNVFDLDTRTILHLYFDEKDDNDKILKKAMEQVDNRVHRFKPYKSARFVKDCVSVNTNS